MTQQELIESVVEDPEVKRTLAAIFDAEKKMHEAVVQHERAVLRAVKRHREATSPDE